jgi:hypothetical protein
MGVVRSFAPVAPRLGLGGSVEPLDALASEVDAPHPLDVEVLSALVDADLAGGGIDVIARAVESALEPAEPDEPDEPGRLTSVVPDLGERNAPTA